MRPPPPLPPSFSLPALFCFAVLATLDLASHLLSVIGFERPRMRNYVFAGKLEKVISGSSHLVQKQGTKREMDKYVMGIV